MKIAVLGTGTVGRTLAGALRERGHEVQVGSRQAGEDKVTFGEAAAGAELVINATPGGVSLEVLDAAGAENLDDKVLIDVANPLDFSHGFPPSLSVCNTDSLGEQIQRAHPGAKVVKALNTVGAPVMVDPGDGDHTLFICGDDAEAKETVKGLLRELGWPDDAFLDLGGIDAARGTEMYLPLWVRLYSATQDGRVTVKVRSA